MCEGINVEYYYRRYGPMVLRRCHRLLGDEEQALDAMQDTFVNVLRNESRLKHQAPSSLLFRIATNLCLNRIRTRKRHPENPDDRLLQRIASCQEPFERSVTRSTLAKLFGREPESTRTIAVLHLLDGLTLDQVAREVGLSVSGVRKRIRRLRARLEEIEGGKS